ncbi:hypothetical protein LTT66_10760 [Nocardia gipuzkoensis]|uniref:hypothetical protein n=1 Tax=Nocardia gipuzkoensis TaxID=2749991 RepID=UPI001E625174|nr:hypothetical protein [Nocardia gipuzkoensis]UGT70602.1 hypothetical protein LTT66_10760 [Nocardia gipuzkoensis]
MHAPTGAQDAIVPLEMSTVDIRATIADFVPAARNAIAAGVEVHSANGYPVTALADRGLAYLHYVFADPDHALLQRIRALWPGVLIADPNLGWGVPPARGRRQASRAAPARGRRRPDLAGPFLPANPDLVERFRTPEPRARRVPDVRGRRRGIHRYPALAPAAG